VLLQKSVDLHPRLETKEPPKLRSGESARPICFECQGLESRERQIFPRGLQSAGDVLRQLKCNLHRLPFLLSIMSVADLRTTSIIIGAAHVVPALAAYQLALQFRQPGIAAGTKEHRLIVAGSLALLSTFPIFRIHID